MSTRSQRFLAVPLLLLLACAREADVPREVRVNESTQGPVSLRVGDTVTVRLSVHMSSGSSWRVGPVPSQALTLLGQEVVPLENQVTPSGMVGQEEVQVFRFKALAPGEVSLDFSKGRPWEKPPPEKRLLVLLAVAER